MVSAWKSDAPSYRTVARWVEEFRKGRKELTDQPRCGRPITASRDDNVTRTAQNAKKQMFAFFVSPSGPVASVLIPRNETVNAHLYCNNILKKVVTLHQR